MISAHKTVSINGRVGYKYNYYCEVDLTSAVLALQTAVLQMATGK